MCSMDSLPFKKVSDDCTDVSPEGIWLQDEVMRLGREGDMIGEGDSKLYQV